MNLAFYIEDFFKSLSAESTNNLFLITLIFLFVLVVLLLGINFLSNQEKCKEFINHSPTFLTSIGILGTFIGIVSALLHFDITDVNGSITSLLAGMKTAFLTSVIGVFLSVFLKFIILGIKRKPKSDMQDNEVTEKVIESIIEQRKGIDKLVEKQQELLTEQQNLIKSIGGDNDSSLTVQLMRLRTALTDKQQEANELLKTGQQHFSEFEKTLGEKLDDFAEKMSKSATEQVIEALKQVIVDFNNNLTEQFGENFKALNHAVLGLVAWQENYKQQLTEMAAQYALGVKAISDTEQSVKQIEQSSSAIPQTMDNLKAVMETNQHQISELNRHLNTFAELKDKAVNALPEVQSHISQTLKNMTNATTELTKGIQNNTERFTRDIHNSIVDLNNEMEENNTKFKKLLQQTNEEFIENTNIFNNNIDAINDILLNNSNTLKTESQHITDNLRQYNQEFNRTITEVQSQFRNNADEIIRHHINESHKMLSGIEAQSQKALDTTAESLQKQLQMIDESMEQEISRAINALGNALAGIATGLTQSYDQAIRNLNNNRGSRF